MIKKLTAWFLLALMVVATSWALLHPEFFRVHDYVHGARIGEMSTGLKEGHFPVRWSGNFGYGFGMPLFEFYAPLPFVVGAVLYLSGLELILVIKLLWLLTGMVTAVGSYKLGSSLFGRTAGVVTAAALTMAPYRALNLYVRGALGEAWGILALPWILYGIVLVVRKKPNGWLVLSLSVAGLCLSHNLTLIFIPLSGLFALGFFLIERARFNSVRNAIEVLGKLTLGYVLGIALAAFYMFPAFVEKDATKVSKIVGGYFDYHLHFLYIRQLITPYWGYGGSGWGPSDDISFFLGVGQLLAVGVTVMVVGWYIVRHRRVTTQLQLLGLIASLLGLSLFMTLLRSQPVWDAIPLLSFIQFPWRWLSGAILFLSLFAGAGVGLITKASWRYALGAVLTLTMIVFNWNYFRPESYLDDASSLYYTDPQRIQQHMSNILNDYVPVQMPDQLVPPSSLVLQPAAPEPPPSLMINRAHEKLLITDFPQETMLEFAMANFPGWRAELDGEPLEIGTTQAGLITVTVPKGEHKLGIIFGSTPVRTISDTITLAAVVILLFLLIKPRSTLVRQKSA